MKNELVEIEVQIKQFYLFFRTDNLLLIKLLNMENTNFTNYKDSYYLPN